MNEMTNIKMRFKGIKRIQITITPYIRKRELYHLIDKYVFGETQTFSVENQEEVEIPLPKANKYEIIMEVETYKGKETVKETVIAHPKVKQNIRFLKQIGIVNKDVVEYARITLEGVAHPDIAERYIGKSEVYKILKETF
jgi:hypothetical protein